MAGDLFFLCVIIMSMINRLYNVLYRPRSMHEGEEIRRCLETLESISEFNIRITRC
jgi:hypothetical protein